MNWNEFGESFEDAYDGDPFNDLELSEEDREGFLYDSRQAFIVEVDAILQEYGAEVLADGKIVYLHDRSDFKPDDPRELRRKLLKADKALDRVYKMWL